MKFDTVIVPGWAIPTEKYSEFSTESSHILDYGYFSSETEHVDLNQLYKKIDAITTDNAVLIAHSMGSAIALKTAIELDSITALVLISPFARFTADKFDSEYLGQDQANIATMIRMITARTKIVLKGFYRDTFAPEKSTITIPENSDPQALLEGLNFLSTVDCRGFLKDISIPVLIIQGEADRVVNPQIAQYLRKHIKNSEYVSVPNSGHALPLTNTVYCKDLITNFLRKHSISYVTVPSEG